MNKVARMKMINHVCFEGATLRWRFCVCMFGQTFKNKIAFLFFLGHEPSNQEQPMSKLVRHFCYWVKPRFPFLSFFFFTWLKRRYRRKVLILNPFQVHASVLSLIFSGRRDNNEAKKEFWWSFQEKVMTMVMMMLMFSLLAWRLDRNDVKILEKPLPVPGHMTFTWTPPTRKFRIWLMNVLR